MKIAATLPSIPRKHTYAATGALVGAAWPWTVYAVHRLGPRTLSELVLARLPSRLAQYAFMSAAAAAALAGFGALLGGQRDARRRTEQQAQQMRDEFAALVAHDFRDPIAAIVATAESLLRKAEDGEVRVPVASLNRLEMLGWRLNRLVADLVDADLVDRGRLALERHPVRLQEMLPRLSRQLGAELGEHPVTVRFSGRPQPVDADAFRLEQVFTNLLENAAKYSPAGAPIEIVVGELHGATAVEVIDRGRGIAPGELPRLFDRVYQASRAREHKTGLGLGLYITRGIVDAHGGRVEVQSEPGRGSTFRVVLPALASPARESAPQAERKSDFNAVVTVRDKAFNRAMRILGELGEVSRTGFYNVLTLRVDDPQALEERLRARGEQRPQDLECFSCVVPVTATFGFQTASEFEERARAAVEQFLPSLAGRSFHVRLHRRGFKGRISTHETERRLGEHLIEQLQRAGTPGRIDFRDPDAILAIETIGTRAGASLWSRDELARYPLLNLD